MSEGTRDRSEVLRLPTDLALFLRPELSWSPPLLSAAAGAERLFGITVQTGSSSRLSQAVAVGQSRCVWGGSQALQETLSSR